MNKVLGWFKSIFASTSSTNKTSELSSVTVESPSTRNDAIDDSENKKQIFNSVKNSFIEGVKCAFATLLSIFCPQSCGDHTCTLYENFIDLTLFNEFVIAWNFITLGLIAYTTVLQNRREAYLISHLEESKEHAYNSLSVNCQQYPRILRKVKTMNDQLYNWSIATTIFFGLNVLFSALLVYVYFYDGFRSITTLIANVLLVTNKLYTLIEVCQECRGAKVMALSTLRQNPVSYNTIDDKYALPTESMRTNYVVGIKMNKAQLKKIHNARIRSQSLPARNP